MSWCKQQKILKTRGAQIPAFFTDLHGNFTLNSLPVYALAVGSDLHLENFTLFF